MKIETQCLHEGYTPKNGEPRVVPIVQSTTYVYDSSREIAEVFDDPTKSLIYSRFENPTTDAVEKKIAALEGGAAAMCTSSGQAATLCSILNICQAGDSFIASTSIYGGTINLFSITMKRLGIECIFVDPDATDDEIQAAFKDNTKLVFGETIANPALTVFDIERFANIAHKNGVPLIVDNTFATPYLCRPIEWGADLVIHSATKFLGGHGSVMAGVVVDSGKFAFKGNPRFPLFNEPDVSYHGVVFADLGEMAFISRLRALITRDIGACLSASAAHTCLTGMETLALRMQRHCENALAVAKFLEAHPAVEKVNYPALPSNKYYELCKKYCPKGAGGVFTFVIKGGKPAGEKFMNSLELLQIVANVGDVRSQVIHPASTTHSQLSPEQLVAAGISEGTVRLTIGIEDINDIIADISQALDKATK